MLTAIEQFLFRRNTAHQVFEFTVSWKRLVLKLVTTLDLEAGAWDKLTPSVVAEFADVTIAHIDIAYCNAKEMNLPWDIIGFDCQPLADGRWQFVLHTSGGEYCFEACWPRVIPNDRDNKQSPP